MRVLLLFVAIFMMNSCSTPNKKRIITKSKDNSSSDTNIKFGDGPQVIIYKTKKNYNKFVPVILSEDKSRIVSYPHPSDVYYIGELAYPTELIKGYLLDNRGINVNVAFLNITYEDYSRFDSVPEIESLFSKIIDNAPLVEIYNCGSKYNFEDKIVDVNKFIKNNGLKKCKCLNKN